MLNFRIQVPDRRIVGKKRDHDHRRISRKKVAFDNDHEYPVIFCNIVTDQGFHEALPGVVMMSASGCPLRSCHSDWRANASAFSSRHFLRRISETASTSAASATADTLIPSSRARSSVSTSRVRDVLRFVAELMRIYSGLYRHNIPPLSNCNSRTSPRSAKWVRPPARYQLPSW